MVVHAPWNQMIGGLNINSLRVATQFKNEKQDEGEIYPSAMKKMLSSYDQAFKCP